MKLGLITYHMNHLKTEQVLLDLIQKNRYDLHLYGLPFSPRKKRNVLVEHRPPQFQAQAAYDIAESHALPYKHCESDVDIDAGMDFYLILGAGIISERAVSNKKIINLHPGIIPTARGLDAFKWSIYHLQPLGCSVHFIDKEVDAGELLHIEHTPVYRTDTLETLAKRHYDNEINLSCNFESYLEQNLSESDRLVSLPPNMRMCLDKEKVMLERFDEYISKFALS